MDIFYVFLLLFTEILLLGVAWVTFKGDIISPSIVTLILFILSTACFAFSTNEWTVVFGFKAYALFTLSFVLMILTEWAVMKNKIRLKRSMKHKPAMMFNEFDLYIPQPFDWLLFIVLSGFAILYIYRVCRTGRSLGAESLLMAIGVNKEKGDFDIISRLLYNLTRMASYVYVVIFCNNVFTCREKIKKNWRSFVIIGMTLLMTFFSGQRSSSICYLAGVVVAIGISIYIRGGNTKNVDTKKFFKKLIIVAVAVLAVFYLSSNIVKGTSIQRNFVSYMLYYFGSTTSLMGRIVYEPALCHTPFVGYFGEKTFNGFWKDMYSWGIVGSAPTDRSWINMGSALYPTRAGNEYTFLCAPYIDFGFVGALIFVVIFYAVYAYIYYRKIRENSNIRNRTAYSATYIFLYAMVVMTFYQDTIRSYTRLINILYIIFIVLFCNFFVRVRGNTLNANHKQNS